MYLPDQYWLPAVEVLELAGTGATFMTLTELSPSLREIDEGKVKERSQKIRNRRNPDSDVFETSIWISYLRGLTVQPAR